MMQHTHSDAQDSHTASSLFHNMNFWEQKRISFKNVPFYRFEELVLHSFDARVLGLLYTILIRKKIDMEQWDIVAKHLVGLIPQMLLDLIDEIRRALFSQD